MMSALFKRSRIKDLKYLRFVSSLPCIISGVWSEDVCGHHLLRGVDRGMGMKASDDVVLPMNYRYHMSLHASGDETWFLAKHGVMDAPSIARYLYELYQSNDVDGCNNLVITKGIYL